MTDPEAVFVSFDSDGNPHGVYADAAPGGRCEFEEMIINDLRSGLVLKRISANEYRQKYESLFLKR